jgi:hypothetical protein
MQNKAVAAFRFIAGSTLRSFFVVPSSYSMLCNFNTLGQTKHVETVDCRVTAENTRRGGRRGLKIKSESHGSVFQLNNVCASRLRYSDCVAFGRHFECRRERYAYAAAFQPLSSKPVNSAYAKDHVLKTGRCTDTTQRNRPCDSTRAVSSAPLKQIVRMHGHVVCVIGRGKFKGAFPKIHAILLRLLMVIIPGNCVTCDTCMRAVIF